MLGRLFRRAPKPDPVDARAEVYTGPTKRIGVDFIEFGYGYGGSVDNRALMSSAVWACVHKIASRVAIAEFAVSRYNRSKRMWQPSPNHPLNGMLRMPSPRLPGSLFWRTLAEHLLVEGNAYAITGKRDMAGHPMYLMIANPWSININQLSRQMTLEYSGTISTPGGVQTEWRRPAHSMVHARGPYYDISTGRSVSPVRYAAKQSIELLNTSLTTANRAMSNASRISGLFKTQIAGVDNPETEAYFDRLKDTIRDKGAGLVPVLPHGVDYQQLPAMQSDMQLAADLNWTVQDIARVYGVPLALIQHTGGQRPDIEQLEDGLLRDAVWPVLHALAGAASMGCLTQAERQMGYAIRPSITAGGPTQSGAAAMAMTMGQTGAVTINEVRAVLGLPPLPDGDELPQTAGAGERETGDTGDGGGEEDTSDGDDTEGDTDDDDEETDDDTDDS